MKSLKTYISTLLCVLFPAACIAAVTFSNTDLIGVGTSSAGMVVDSSGNMGLTGALTATGVTNTGTLTNTGALAVTGNVTATGVATSTGAINYGYVKQGFTIVTSTTGISIGVSTATAVYIVTAPTATVTLPTAVGNGGVTFTVKKSTSTAGTVTLATNGSETIDGVDNNTEIDANKDFLSIMSDNANWVVINRYIQ